MKKIIVSTMLYASFGYAVDPEVTTTTQIKEQIQKIEVPSHIKGLRIVNNNTLRWSDTVKPSYHEQEYYRKRDMNYKQQESARPGKRSALGLVCYTSVLGAACVYACARLMIHQFTQELEKESRWWNWKPELSLSALTQMPEKQLAQELLASIHERYDKKTVNDVAFIMPLVHFIQDTNNEQNMLERFIKIYEESRSSYVMQYVITFDEQLIVQARTKLARLNYIRELCIKWLSSYAVDVPAIA